MKTTTERSVRDVLHRFVDRSVQQSGQRRGSPTMTIFLAPMVVLSLISLAGLGYVVFRLSPEETSSVVLFLGALFSTVTLLLSLIIFTLHRRFFFKAREFTAMGPVVNEDDLRRIYRRSLKLSLLLAAIVIFALIYVKIR